MTTHKGILHAGARLTLPDGSVVVIDRDTPFEVDAPAAPGFDPATSVGFEPPPSFPHDPDSFGAGLVRSAIEQGVELPVVAGVLRQFYVEGENPALCLRCAPGMPCERHRAPAPAWTREAPKEPGRYWVRWPQDGRSVTLDLGYFSGLGWSFGYASGIGHDGEHWPVRVEPPK